MRNHPPPDVLQVFRPCPGLGSAHVQTVAAAVLTWSWEPPSHTAWVTLPDGDVLALEVSTPSGWQPHHPTVVLVHGLCGSHRSPYMQRLTWRLSRLGLRTVRMNLRGCGSGIGLARQPYHSGRSADVLAVVEALHAQTPDSPVTLVGFSLGGNLVLKLAGEMGGALPGTVRQVIAVCPPVDLEACAQRLAEPAQRLYDIYFTRQLCIAVRQRHAQFPDLPHACLPTRWSVLAFDTCYTAPHCGFLDASDYYRRSSAAPLLSQIAVPCHILWAADDPLLDVRSVAQRALPPHVQVLCTPAGGHLGFLGWPGQPWGYRAMDGLVIAWITAGQHWGR